MTENIHSMCASCGEPNGVHLLTCDRNRPNINVAAVEAAFGKPTAEDTDYEPKETECSDSPLGGQPVIKETDDDF